MLKYCILIFIVNLQINCWSQIKEDSIIGTFIYSDWVGGGFSGDGNGNCYANPPDYTFDHTVIIDSNFLVTKNFDTTGIVNSFCSTQKFLGNAEIINDTLILTFNKKKLCSNLYIGNKEYEELIRPMIIEKYYFRYINDALFSFKLRNEELTWENEYKKQ